MNDFQYAYPFASVIEEGTAHQKNFIFSHCSELKEDNAVPCFFWGHITQPFVVAKCLATLAKTVASQFAIAPGVLAKPAIAYMHAYRSIMRYSMGSFSKVAVPILTSMMLLYVLSMP